MSPVGRFVLPLRRASHSPGQGRSRLRPVGRTHAVFSHPMSRRSSRFPELSLTNMVDLRREAVYGYDIETNCFARDEYSGKGDV